MNQHSIDDIVAALNRIANELSTLNVAIAAGVPPTKAAQDFLDLRRAYYAGVDAYEDEPLATLYEYRNLRASQSALSLEAILDAISQYKAACEKTGSGHRMPSLARFLRDGIWRKFVTP